MLFNWQVKHWHCLATLKTPRWLGVVLRPRCGYPRNPVSFPTSPHNLLDKGMSPSSRVASVTVKQGASFQFPLSRLDGVPTSLISPRPTPNTVASFTVILCANTACLHAFYHCPLDVKCSSNSRVLSQYFFN